jgi:putative endonuclease
MRPEEMLGRLAEELAAEYGQDAGFRILDRNRCADGEIDVGAADRRGLAACEVKTRSELRYGTPVEGVTRRKLRRLRRLAAIWASTLGWFFDHMRVDIVGVLRSPSGECTIEHLRGVG